MSDEIALEEDAVSSVYAVVPDSSDQRLRPLALESLATVDQRMDDMLHRLHHRDHLGALVLAKVIARDAPDHGLLGICKKEALTALKPLLGAPLLVCPIDVELSAASKALLSTITKLPSTPVGTLVPDDEPACIEMLCALHELLCAGVVHAAENAPA